MGMKLLQGKYHADSRRPCTRCAGTGCAECAEVGTLQAQERQRQEATYRVQIEGMPDRQLLDCAHYEALTFVEQFGSFQAWYVGELLREVGRRAEEAEFDMKAGA